MHALSQQPSIITALIYGGLGNQLFCYAAARRLALVNDAELVLDNVSGFQWDKYQRHWQLGHFNINGRRAIDRERFEPFGRVRRKLARMWNAKLPFEKRWYIRQQGPDFDPRLVSLRPNHNIYLHGYWQSEDYFKDIEATIRQDLQITPPTDEANREMAKHIGGQLAVAVHVRFFDEPQSSSSINNAAGNYYNRAVVEMEARAPNAHYFIFSDNPIAARTRIPLSDDRITLVMHNHGDENAYADLWLMTQCNHFIIANSTFSWWGAWLGKQSLGSIVIAPYFTISGEGKTTSWGFRGLLPDTWSRIECM